MSKPELYYRGELLNVAGILNFINAFAKASGISVMDVSIPLINEVISFTNSGIVRETHMSPFKKVARFMCAFSCMRPISTEFPEDVFGKEITSISNHQNAIIAFEIGRVALHGAQIFTPQKILIIKNQIALSRHMYRDTILFLASINERNEYVHAVALFLESLCYKANPNLEYSPEMHLRVNPLDKF